MRSALLAFALLAACGPSVNPGDDDDDTGDPCTGDATRCEGNLYEICDGDSFVVADTCENACSPTLGCADCDPAQGNACNGDTTVVSCNADGTLGGVVETCTDGTSCIGGDCTRSCAADGVDLIYVVDTSNRLLSFDPRQLDSGGEPFTVLGTLNCPASTTPAPGWLDDVAPFSMAVDRNAVAWILYSSGEIFNVDVNNASVCQPTSYNELQNGWLLFGMGFVTDTAGGDTEKLYVGGGSVTADPGGKFGYMNDQLVIQDLGTLPDAGENSPELSGTGAAEAWGFYPGQSSAFVQQISKTDGAAVGAQFAIPGGLGGLVQAWAFAQWGGKFYLFVTTQDLLGNSNSTVRRIDKATGNYEGVVRQNLPYIIVGAGVSTCAPVVVEYPKRSRPPG